MNNKIRARLNNQVETGINYEKYILLLFGITHILLIIYNHFLLKVQLNSLLVYLIILASFISIAMFIVMFSNDSKVIYIISLLNIVVTCIIYLIATYSIDNYIIQEILYILDITLCIYIMSDNNIVNVCLLITICSVYVAFCYKNGYNLKITYNMIIYYLWAVFICSIIRIKINGQKESQYAMRKRLEAMIETDHLTRAYNRNKCDNEIIRLCKINASFSVVMFDIDNFKRINDTFGHPIGDKVLMAVSSAVLNNSRKSDMFARWGGEEFVIVYYETKLTSAVMLAERIRKVIEEINIEEINYNITASFGVTSYVAGDTLHSIIERVDKLMYQAKIGGKNNVKY